MKETLRVLTLQLSQVLGRAMPCFAAKEVRYDRVSMYCRHMYKSLACNLHDAELCIWP